MAYPAPFGNLGILSKRAGHNDSELQDHFADITGDSTKMPQGSDRRYAATGGLCCEDPASAGAADEAAAEDEADAENPTPAGASLSQSSSQPSSMMPPPTPSRHKKHAARTGDEYPNNFWDTSHRLMLKSPVTMSTGCLHMACRKPPHQVS